MSAVRLIPRDAMCLWVVAKSASGRRWQFPLWRDAPGEQQWSDGDHESMGYTTDEVMKSDWFLSVEVIKRFTAAEMGGAK